MVKKVQPTNNRIDFFRDLYAAALGKGEQLKEKFGVFLGAFVVVGVNDTDLAPCLGGALDGALQISADLPAIGGEGRVGLIADYSVIKTDSF